MRARWLSEKRSFRLFVPSSPEIVGVSACPVAGPPCSETDAGTWREGTRSVGAGDGRRRFARNTSAPGFVSHRRTLHSHVERRRS